MEKKEKDAAKMVESFSVSKKRGDQGEAFFAEHAGHILTNALMFYKQRGDNAYVEGMDFFGLVLIGAKEEPLTQGEREVCPDAGKKWILETAESAVEVKLIGNFLTRNNNRDEESGTVEFELWTSRNRKKLGWLHGMCYPQVHNRDPQKADRGIYVVPPTSLVYLYCDQNGKPFVAVAFENFKALKARLMEICPEIWPEGDGEWRTEAVDWEKQRSLIPTFGENMWHVPFDMISDLATVTMIGDDPELIGWGHSKELQEKRLAYLKKCANGRHMDVTD